MIVKSKLLGRLTAAWLVLAASAAEAAPLTLDRLLKLEDLGATALSPDGKHLVIETRAPLNQAARFDFDTPDARIGRLMVADIASGTPAHPLIATEPGAGYTAGPFSPSGRRMIVSRWKDGRWTAGVVELETGGVRWLPFGIDETLYGRSLQWLSDTTFVAIALAADDVPRGLKLGSQNQARLTALWAQQAAGQVASIKVSGSGRARRPEPRRDRRLMRVNLTTGAQAVLATGGFLDLELSPSHRYVAVLGEAERIGLVQAPAVRMMAPGRRRALSIVDLNTGAVNAICSSCNTLIEPMVWAPGLDRLLVFQHAADKGETTGALTVIDARRGEIRKVGAMLTPSIDYGSEGVARVRADWFAAHPIALGKTDDAARADWYDVAGDTPVNLTSALPSSPDSIAFGGDAAMFAMAQGRVWRIGATGEAEQTTAQASGWFRPSAFALGIRPKSAPWRAGDLRLLTPSGVTDLSGHPITLPPDAKPLIATSQGLVFEARPPTGVGTIGLLDDHGRRRDLVTVNADLATVETGPVRFVETRAANGQMMKSWVLLPPTWRPGDKPPLVVVPYPGSSPQSFPWRFTIKSNNLNPSPSLLAALGYAVLAPALPRDRGRGEPGSGLADEILSVVDAVVAQGLADPDRLALWGHSFGGYAALVTATQTHRFKAIVAQAGSSDYVSTWASTEPYVLTATEDGGPTPNYLGYNETGQGGMKGPPWRETERYLRNSPLMQADKITTPMMLIYGEQDFVPLSQGQAMFNALYRQDKDATLVTMFGEAHLPASPANIRAIYAEVLPWLADRLAAPSASAAVEANRPSQ
jgi:dipeptidyl aminopeptidase/acylaminoacyl peptidase